MLLGQHESHTVDDLIARDPHSACDFSWVRCLRYQALYRPSPTAWPLRGYMRAGTQNDRLDESFPTVCGTLAAHFYTHVYTHVHTHVHTHVYTHESHTVDDLIARDPHSACDFSWVRCLRYQATPQA